MRVNKSGCGRGFWQIVVIQLILQIFWTSPNIKPNLGLVWLMVDIVSQRRVGDIDRVGCKYNGFDLTVFFYLFSEVGHWIGGVRWGRFSAGFSNLGGEIRPKTSIRMGYISFFGGNSNGGKAICDWKKKYQRKTQSTSPSQLQQSMPTKTRIVHPSAHKIHPDPGFRRGPMRRHGQGSHSKHPQDFVGYNLKTARQGDILWTVSTVGVWGHRGLAFLDACRLFVFLNFSLTKTF